jgi:C4-type Zn-finger protein
MENNNKNTEMTQPCENAIMSSDEIFDYYIEEKCPCCKEYIDADSNYAHTEHGGKCMAKHFDCKKCHSRYTIGFNRNSMPIKSEITKDNYNR